jgi:glycosyltransferase involved in cell wall biosynthesis
MSARAKVLHALKLHGIGGVERIFEGYLEGTRDHRLEHHVLVLGGRVHPYFRELLRRRAASVHFAKYIGRLKLPRLPGFLRKLHLTRIVDKLRPDVFLLYNRFGHTELVEPVTRVSELPIRLHYEHGTGWGRHDADRASRFLDMMDGTIAVCRAARRVLELKWSCPAEKGHTCYNGVRLAPPPGVVPKSMPVSRPLRLGWVGKLDWRKAPVVAVHTLARLKAAGRPFELHVAGEGPEFQNIQALAGQLNVASDLRMHGLIEGMEQFYSDTDILIHPSAHEALPTVCIEAARFGCPVVATAVDGMPEIVEDGQTGYCVPATEPPEYYSELGGSQVTDPEPVYDPETDRLVPLRFPTPDALAEAVLCITESDAKFRRMSARAHATTRQKFGLAHYYERLNGLLLRFAGARGLQKADVHVE